MTYSNINPSVTQETASFISTPIYYNTIPLLDSIPHDSQVVVERIFDTELAGSANTLSSFLASGNVSPFHKRQIFKIPNTRLTFNQTTKTITSVYLPTSGAGVYNYITSGFSVSVPPLTVGQKITVERKTVSNVPLITWVPGSKLTTLQLNRAATQNLFLTQEILSLIDRKIAYDGNSTVEIPDDSITSLKIVAGAILPYHLSTSTLDWSLVGTLAISSLTASLPLFSDSTQKIVTRSITGVAASSVVLQDSPTLITPNLGTPSTLIGTNITGTATNFTSTTCTTIPALSGNVTSSGNAVTLNAAQSGITSLGTLTGLTVSGTSSLGILNTSGLSTLASLTVTGASSLSTLSTSGLSTLASLSVTGASSLNTLSTSGLSTLASLSVTGASTLASLSVTGASSLNTLGTSGLSTLASLTVTGASSLSTLSTSGLSTLASLTVTGSSTLNTVGVSGTSTLGVLNATGNASITGDLTILGNISWTGNAAGTSATSQQVADPKIYLAASPCAFTGSIASTTLTVTFMTTNQFLSVGTIITGTGVTSGTRVTAYGTATGATGTYTVTPSQTVASTPTMAGTGSSSTLSNGGGVVLMADGSIGNRTITCDTTAGTWNFNQGIKLSSGKALILQGSTSGTVTITPAAVAGTTVLTLPTTTDTLIGRDTTDTLTNKTLTTPVISSITNTGTLTLPTSTDTLIGRATTDTLTNKTWSSAVIAGQYGGTGVANTGKTITLGGNLTTSFATTLNSSAATSVTLPLTGTLISDSSTDTLTNKTWSGNVIAGQYGGTGVANTGKTITLGGNLTTTGGAFNTTLTVGANTNVTLPAAGTLITDSSTNTLTNKTWNSDVITGLYGGTGVNNNGKTITLGGNLITSGNFATTLTSSNTTNVTLPLTGTLATLAGTESLSNKTFVGPILGTPASGNLSNCTSIPISGLTGTLGVGNGGTGLTAIAANSVLISNATANAITPLALGAANQVLRVNSGGTGIEWGGASGSTILPTSNGGTGKDNTAWTPGCIVIGSATTGQLTTLNNDIAGQSYDGAVLTADSSATNGVKWAMPSSTGSFSSGNQIIDSSSGSVVGIVNNFSTTQLLRNTVVFTNGISVIKQITCRQFALGGVNEYIVYMPPLSGATNVDFTVSQYSSSTAIQFELISKAGHAITVPYSSNNTVIRVTGIVAAGSATGFASPYNVISQYKVFGIRVTQNVYPLSSSQRLITIENLFV